MAIQKEVKIELKDYVTKCYECEVAGYKDAGWTVVGSKPEVVKVAQSENTQPKTKRGIN